MEGGNEVSFRVAVEMFVRELDLGRRHTPAQGLCLQRGRHLWSPESGRDHPEAKGNDK